MSDPEAVVPIKLVVAKASNLWRELSLTTEERPSCSTGLKGRTTSHDLGIVDKRPRLIRRREAMKQRCPHYDKGYCLKGGCCCDGIKRKCMKG